MAEKINQILGSFEIWMSKHHYSWGELAFYVCEILFIAGLVIVVIKFRE